MREDSIVGKMLKGEYPATTVKTKYGDFEIKYLTGKEEDMLSRLRASRLGGLPFESFDKNSIAKFNVDSTLEVCIKEYPKNFPEEWQKSGIIDFPDQEVKNSLFNEFWTFLDEVSKSISKENR